jgi:hypothetical protein
MVGDNTNHIYHSFLYENTIWLVLSPTKLFTITYFKVISLEGEEQ